MTDHANDVCGTGMQPDEDTHAMVVPTNRLSTWQVETPDGAFVYKVTDKERLLRFIILGTETGSYHYEEKQLSRESVQCIDRLIIQDRGKEVVDVIKTVSKEGRACKANCTVYALAICARSNDLDTKMAAYEALSDVCTIPTGLFAFIRYCEEFSAGTGWGRAHRRAIAKWYNNYDDKIMELVYRVTKYRRRHNWEHKDVVRLAHIRAVSEPMRLVIVYLVKGLAEARKIQMPMAEEEVSRCKAVMDYLEAVEKALICRDETEMVELIHRYGLVREHVPTPLLKSVQVWRELLKKMPLKAMMRNLGKMGSLHMLAQGSEEESIVVDKLKSASGLRAARIHPFSVLIALNVYSKGKGDKGKLNWPRNSHIVEALDAAYDLCFANVEPTNKRYCLAVDVSGSMNVPMMGTESVTVRDGAAAMMMVTARTEPNFDVYAFCHNYTKLNVTKSDTLQTIQNMTYNLSFGATDCSLPMLNAISQKKKFDVFVVYTDSETNYGSLHPSQALENYRTCSGIKDARLIVVGMSSTGFTIADPTDRYMMDVVGFDSNAPEAMRHFIEGYGGN